jgi:hypothetical protein
MTYDEQRALLGLPDVRAQVAWMHLGIAAREICRVVAVAWETIRPTFEQLQAIQADYALANGDQP